MNFKHLRPKVHEIWHITEYTAPANRPVTHHEPVTICVCNKCIRSHSTRHGEIPTYPRETQIMAHVQPAANPHLDIGPECLIRYFLETYIPGAHSMNAFAFIYNIRCWVDSKIIHVYSFMIQIAYIVLCFLINLSLNDCHVATTGNEYDKLLKLIYVKTQRMRELCTLFVGILVHITV